MQELSEYLARAKQSHYFSGVRAAGELATFQAIHGETVRTWARDSDDPERLLLVGSGGSYANLLSAKYVFDRLLDIPCDVYPSYELIWRAPKRLNSRSVVLFASLSGETEDTVAAMRFANSAGARTLALVGRNSSTLGNEARDTITYNGAVCYEVPLAAAILFGAALAERGGDQTLAASLVQGLEAIPDALDRAMENEGEHARQAAEAFRDSTHIFVLGAGPLSPLAYKFAMSVIMENLRMAASYCDATEFRHGPAEALERVKPDFIFLVGTDDSRPVTLRTVEFCRSRATRFLTYDAASFGDIHPLLAPLAMNSLLQWFIVHSAYARGIYDLDERVFMGRGILASGGAAWP